MAESGVDAIERIQVSVRDEPAAKTVEAAWRELDAQSIFAPGVLILGTEAGEFLEGLRNRSATSFSGVWIDEGALLPPADTHRRVVLRRVLQFATGDELRRFIAGSRGDERDASSASENELVASEVRFTLVPSKDRSACRIVLESIHARRDTAPALRLLQHEGSIDLVVAFTLRSVTRDVQSHTALFHTTLVADGPDWRSVRQESDWFPPGADAAPWSLHVTIFDREEVRQLASELGEAAGFVLEIVAKAKKAGIL
jgi:hypothetical protein